ncbi:MAG: hypothetical protein ACMG6S_36935 [Byssovorax sp.]
MNSRALSSSTNLFHDSAEQLALRLEQESSPEAVALAREARALTKLFFQWQTSRPSDADRVAGIQRLFEINSLARDLLER